MTAFEDRESAFENKFAHDADMMFRAQARRNKLLGLWVAEILGKTGDDANAYAHSIIKADLEEPGEEDVFRKVQSDLGRAVSSKLIREQMARLLQQAKAELMDEV